MNIKYTITACLLFATMSGLASDKECPGLSDWNPQTKSIEMMPCYCGPELQKLPISMPEGYGLTAACNIRESSSGSLIDLLKSAPRNAPLPSGTYLFKGRIKVMGTLVSGMALNGIELNFFPDIKQIKTSEATRAHFQHLSFSSEDDELFKLFGNPARPVPPEKPLCATVTLNILESSIGITPRNESVHIIDDFEIAKRGKFKPCPNS